VIVRVVEIVIVELRLTVIEVKVRRLVRLVARAANYWFPSVATEDRVLLPPAGGLYTLSPEFYSAAVSP